MRVISQDGRKDIPYETSVLFALSENVYAIIPGEKEHILMGVYKTKEKAKEEIYRIQTHYVELKNSEFYGRKESLFVIPGIKMSLDEELDEKAN